MNIIDSLTNRIEWKVRSFNANRNLQKLANIYDNKFNNFIIQNKVPYLPKSVTIEIKSFWGRYINYDFGLIYHRIAALNNPEESLPYIVSDSIMYPLLIKKLNPEYRARVLGNKGLYHTLFSDVKHPFEIVRTINGNYFDSNNKLIFKDAAINKILSYKQPIVFKKSTQSYGGLGVKIVKEYDESIIKQHFDYFQNNFVVQELLTQSEQTARFNPTSLNTFRVTTLLLNGKLTVLGVWLRCGAKGALVDNLTSGGIASCILPDGRMSCGTNISVPQIDYSPTGLKFEDCHIIHFEQIVEKAMLCHRKIPVVAMIGWDFALDSNDEPVFIEANLRCPDTWPLQMTQGPIFGDRLHEVLDYCFPTGRNV
jgi:hypothetical protein